MARASTPAPPSGSTPAVPGGVVMRTGHGTWTERCPRRITRLDLLAVTPVMLLGLIQFYFCDRARDFTVDAVFYVDAARSLLERGAYLYAGRPETGLPPGLSLLITGLCLAKACGHLAVLRAMVVVQTAGLVLGYLLLRRYSSRLLGGVTVMLIASAPVYFFTVTHALVPNSPLLLYVMAALLLALELERPHSLGFRAGAAVVLALLCAAAVLTATAAIALVGALGLRVLVVWLRDHRAGSIRLALFLPAILFTLAAQGYWMSRPATPLEWPEVGGFPHSYLDQLKLKVGNQPELGLARARDIPARAARNLAGEGAQLAELLVHIPWVSAAWMSPLVAPLIILVLLGWLSSVKASGGGVHDWFFAGNEIIYLLWPWYPEYRFFLQAIPLAVLYAFLGAVALGRLTERHPRRLGWVAFALSLFLLFASWQWHRGVGVGSDLLHGGRQDLGSMVVWLVMTLCSAALIWQGPRWIPPWAALVRPQNGWSHAVWVKRLRVVWALMVLVPVMAYALLRDIQVGQEEINPQSTLNALPADARAASWLRSHIETEAVVMARHVPTVYHYAHRRVVFFPPTRDAGLLAQGIRRLRVTYVLVVHRTDSYYLPPEEACFRPLLTAYPGLLQPIFQNAAFSVYRVRVNAPV